jgi:hypothetical protein
MERIPIYCRHCRVEQNWDTVRKRIIDKKNQVHNHFVNKILHSLPLFQHIQYSNLPLSSIVLLFSMQQYRVLPVLAEGSGLRFGQENWFFKYSFPGSVYTLHYIHKTSHWLSLFNRESAYSTYFRDSHYTATKIRNKYVFREMKLLGLIPNFWIHVYKSDLYFPMIGLPMLLYCVCGPIVGRYKSLTDTWM